MGCGQTIVYTGMTVVMAAGIVFYTPDLAAGKAQPAPEAFVVSLVGSGGVPERQNTMSEEFVSVSPAHPPWNIADLPPFGVR